MGGVAKDDEKLNRSLCQPGARVFYWEPRHAWALGVVEKDDGKFFTVKGHDYSCSKVADLSTEKVGDTKIWPANRDDVLDEDVRDLLDLTILHDATIQRCLYLRYMRDMVYTNIGAIVVALNPWNFKIAWYMDDNMPKYLAEGEVIKENVPHSWAQAHNTYNDMRRESENQTILISGESGAGKTEAAKIVMKYLGAVSCLRGADAMKESAKKVAFNINQASPILEGFGNAKTVRNDNSSRFGKFMKVQFDAEGFLVGAYTIKYLLEKSRIVTANPNERVYHSFYLLLKGKDAGKYQLKSSDNYHVNAGGCIDIPGVDDGDDYNLCLTAMDNCGFDQAQKEGVWACVGGMLHLLQVGFTKVDDDSCSVDSAKMGLLELTAGIWKVDKKTLAEELVTTTIDTRDGPVTKTHTIAKADDARDAVVKATYDQLFAWQVQKINGMTDSGTGQNFIGLLDIFGFEDFEYNSFEQLCINLANETLQNHYNTFIFDKDMAECLAEGVDVTEVKCPDNMPCLVMMNAKSGIFSMLDDECSLGQSGTNEGFLSKVIDTHSSNVFFGQKKLAKNSFIVHHYAASVNYTVEGWLEKNRDTLKPAMKLLMRSSEVPLISQLIDPPDENAKNVTTGGFFKQQLIELMDLINSTQPHWIRCVKPHPAKKPLMVDGIQSMTQLESSGVLGTVKIRKAGFPVRPTYAKFIARFKCIVGSAPALDSEVGVLKAYCQQLIEKAGLESKKAQCGKTKVFLKNEANQELEAVREKSLAIHVRRLVASGLSIVAQMERRRKLWQQSALHIQAETREWLLRSVAERQERERERAALLEQMRAVLGPFDAEHEAATQAILDEEDAEFAALLLGHREGLGGMLAEVMGVVTNAEEEARFVLKSEEDDEWEALAGILAQEKVGLMFGELDAAEQRLRNEIEEEWWLGPQRRQEWTLAEDVTDHVMCDRPTICTRQGLAGALAEFFSKETSILEDNVCEWSEPYNRNVLLKEELRRRQALQRCFVIDYTEARLAEEQLFEFIWREAAKDQEATQFSYMMQNFYAVTRQRMEDPATLKGMSSEPSCRKLVEKERRDDVRRLHRVWRQIGLLAEEERARVAAEGQCYFELHELEKRALLEVQEIELRTGCYEAIEPIVQAVREKREARDARMQRRNRKIHALHMLWEQEADRIEKERFGGVSDDEWKEGVLNDVAHHQQQLINALQRYEEVAAPLGAPPPKAGTHLTQQRRRIRDFEEYMQRVEAGEDVDLDLGDGAPLWQHLVRAGDELSPLRGEERTAVYPYNTLDHPSPLPDPYAMPAEAHHRAPAYTSPYDSRGPTPPVGYTAVPPPAPPPPLPAAPAYDPNVPFLEQVRMSVRQVNDAAADADHFMRTMQHAGERIAVDSAAAMPYGGGRSPSPLRDPSLPVNYDAFGLRPEVLARLTDSQILEGNTGRLSSYHSAR